VSTGPPYCGHHQHICDERVIALDRTHRDTAAHALINLGMADIGLGHVQLGKNEVDTGLRAWTHNYPKSPNWGSTLANTSVYDTALFGWQTTAIVVAGSMPNYVSDGQNNFYGYNNPKVDALAKDLQATTDPARQDEILIEVEKQLFADAFGLPIFQFPEITAYNETYVKGVGTITIAPGVFFNFWDWEPAS